MHTFVDGDSNLTQQQQQNQLKKWHDWRHKIPKRNGYIYLMKFLKQQRIFQRPGTEENWKLPRYATHAYEEKTVCMEHVYIHTHAHTHTHREIQMPREMIH